ncbi:transcription factor E4F1-like [Lineus longissimus]|uniref:transcription factor E4F1-like n=1 Tax=Lineus longissimus TaxID=88925 RepID=UPI00315C587A
MAANETDIESRPTESAQEEDEGGDVHRCGKCKLDFSSIEEFIRHKLDKDNCKVLYKSRHRRVLLPHLVKKPIKTEVITPPVQKNEGTKENLGEKQPVKRKRGRPPNSKQKKSHIEPSAIIESPTNYECLQCKRTFNRGATLRRHMEMIHEAVTLSDEEDGFAALQDDDLQEDAADEEFTSSNVVNPSSQGVRIIRAGGDAPVVVDVTGTAEGSNLEALAQALGTLPSVNESGEQTTSMDDAMLQGDGQNLVEVALMHANIIEMHPPTSAEISAIKPKIEDGDERQHECDICKRRFKELSVLRAHMLTHTNQRDFHCPFHGCRYAFKTKGSLKRHVRRHTDERPYKCYMCDRAFRESGALTRHMKSRSPCVTKTDADLPRYGRIQKLVGGIQKPHVQPVQPVQPVHPDSQDPTEDVPVFEMVVGDNMTDEDEIAVVAQRLEAQSAVALICDACGQQLPSHVKFRLHLQSHINDLPFHCDQCDFVAETKHQLIQHERSRHSLGVLTIGGKPEDSDGFVTGEDVPEENFGRIPVEEVRGNEELQEQVVECEASEEDVIVTETDDDGIETSEVNLESIKPDGEATRGPDGEVNQGTSIPVNEEVIVHHILTPGDEEDQLVTQTGGNEPGGQVSSEEGTVESNTTVHLIIERVEGPDEGEGHQEQSDEEISEKDVTASEHEIAGPDPNVDGNLQMHTYVEPMQVDSQTKKCQSDVVALTELDGLKKKAAVALEQMFKLGYKTTLTPTASNDLRDKKYKNHKKCPYCMRTFRGSSYLRLHMRSHTGERPHKCAHCLKAFTTRDALNKHLYTHTDDRQYKCGECGKLFKRISHVREHLKIHTGERPFVCKICGKGFKTHNACKVHTRTHTSVMPWQCPTCNKRFREKGSLERHVRTHTGNKPYPCPHCHRRFAEHGTLGRHLKAKVPCTRSLFLQRQAEGEPAQAEPMEEYPTLLAEFSSVVADTQQYMIPTTSGEQTEPETTEVVVMGTQEQTEGGSDIIEIIADENNQIINEDGTTAYVILDQSGDKITVLDSKTGETLELIQSVENDTSDTIQVMSCFDDSSQYVTIATDQTVDANACQGEVIASVSVTEDQINEAIAIVREQPIAIDSATLDIQEAIEQAGEIEAVAMDPNACVENDVNSVNVEHVAFSATE